MVRPPSAGQGDEENQGGLAAQIKENTFTLFQRDLSKNMITKLAAKNEESSNLGKSLLDSKPTTQKKEDPKPTVKKEEPKADPKKSRS